VEGVCRVPVLRELLALEGFPAYMRLQADVRTEGNMVLRSPSKFEGEGERRREESFRERGRGREEKVTGRRKERVRG
jgi:hypothetical protein